MTENPCFHDALLTGVSLEDRRAIFAIDHVDGGKWRVVVNDVQALQIDEFREGNIISYFEVVTGTVPPREVLERLFSAPHPDAAKEYHDAYTKLLNDKVEAVLTGAAVMLLISPSYGAEVAVMGASVDRLKIRSP